jgi:hypothetical protein
MNKNKEKLMNKNKEKLMNKNKVVMSLAILVIFIKDVNIF